MIVRRLLVLALAASLVASCDQLQSLANTTVRDDGPYLLLEVDTPALQQLRLQQVADQMAEKLRGSTPAIRLTGRGVVADAARIRVIDRADQARAITALAELGSDFVISSGDDGLIEARIAPAAIARLSQSATSQSIEVLQRRLGQAAAVAQHRNGQIIVRTNAAFDPALRSKLTTTALLTFHNVREVTPDDAVNGRLPPGTMLVNPYPGMDSMSEVVERRPRFTGERLVRADATIDPQTSENSIAFALDAEGTRIFCRITRENTGNRFAVLLDNQVLTAPRINEPICGGSGIISGFSREGAQEMAIMLSAGALPAPLIIVAEGVGPAP
jgi:preprotein translocase subunit SecD